MATGDANREEGRRHIEQFKADLEAAKEDVAVRDVTIRQLVGER